MALPRRSHLTLEHAYASRFQRPNRKRPLVWSRLFSSTKIKPRGCSGWPWTSPLIFEGIPYAPADWQAESSGKESPVSSFEAVVNAPRHVAHGVAEIASSDSPTVRTPALCRLTAISSGGCYVQSATTFPRLTPVTVRVLVTNSERSFMGIEFDGRGRHHQDRVESLIRDLAAGENVGPQVQVELRPCRGSASQTAPLTVASEFHDSLLGLILVGTALKREDFLREPEKQRRSKQDSGMGRQTQRPSRSPAREASGQLSCFEHLR